MCARRASANRRLRLYCSIHLFMLLRFHHEEIENQVTMEQSANANKSTLQRLHYHMNTVLWKHYRHLQIKIFEWKHGSIK